jgi:hypothetical protein
MPTTYFVLDADQSIQIVGHIEDHNSGGLANKFTRGHSLQADEQPKNLSVRVELGPETYPDLFMLQRTPVASSAFVARLRAAGIDNIEAFPAAIVEPTRQILGHFVLNVIGRVSCLDHANSDVTLYDGDVFRVNRLAIDATKTASLDLFRLDEFELLLLISRRGAETLAGLRGVLLPPAEGWSDSAWY